MIATEAGYTRYRVRQKNSDTDLALFYSNLAIFFLLFISLQHSRQYQLFVNKKSD